MPEKSITMRQVFAVAEIFESIAGNLRLLRGFRSASYMTQRLGLPAIFLCRHPTPQAPFQELEVGKCRQWLARPIPAVCKKIEQECG